MYIDKEFENILLFLRLGLLSLFKCILSLAKKSKFAESPTPQIEIIFQATCIFVLQK